MSDTKLAPDNTATFENVKIERDGATTFIILNRPDKRNAMSPQLHMDMDDVLDELAIDDETDILIVTGAGPAFSAGQDIRLYFRGTEANPAMRAKARRASNQWRWQRLSTWRKALAIGGFSLGTFGLGFTLGGLIFGKWRKA